jgi:pilus assembly protein CpaF
MPLVTSQAWIAEKLASYGIDNEPARADEQTDLPSLVATICSRVLDSDPALVADVAAGRTSRQALVALIGRTAEKESLRARFFQMDLQQKVMDFLFGYGPLQTYVDDEQVTDIDGTGPDEFSIKIDGRRQALAISFTDDKAYETFCRLVIIRNGGIINENDSHCRVTDEQHRLRINVTVAPRSVKGASISIRKHRRQALTLTDLKDRGMLDETLVKVLAQTAKSDTTVLFCGKGAAGKTTLLRAFIMAMPVLERVLIAESDSEIYPDKPHCLVQRIKKANEGGRPVSLRDLVADGLTMSLDTYCIGEIVGEEALDFMRAAFSGHRCLATTHANSASDALDRLLTLARPAAHGENDRILRKMLGQSVNCIIFLKDFKVLQVLRVCGYLEGEDRYDFVQVWPEDPGSPAGPAIDLPAGQMVPSA